MNISRLLKLKAASEAQRILEDIAGVTTVVIATPDGVEIASASLRDVDPSRIAAMASSISAMGAVVSQEARLGRCSAQGFSFASLCTMADILLCERTDAEPVQDGQQEDVGRAVAAAPVPGHPR